MSFKRLFSRTLDAAPDRLHFAAHSHHLWPDASFDGQVEAWQDAAGLADRKWDKVMGEVWPEAQRWVAGELGSGDPDAIVFAPNTHDLLIRLVYALGRRPVRILTTDGEFHSARRQLARWEEEGWLTVDRVAVEPFATFDDRFVEAARAGDHELILVSQVMFGSGHVFGAVDRLASLARPDGPWVVIDGYHAFMAVERPLGEAASRSAFYLGGGYKYAMAGEGCCFMNAPDGYAPRPAVTGWFAEFEDLSLPPGIVGYAKDASRFLGATFDPSGLYRFNAVQRMLQAEGLTTGRISAHTETLQHQLLDGLRGAAIAEAELLNPPGGARFLAFRSPAAQRWYSELLAADCITDVRGDVLRIGFAIYQDGSDVERLLGLLHELN